MDTKSQLRKIAGEVEEHRKRLGLTMSGFCRNFGTVGSQKTFARFLNPEDALDGMDLIRWLEDYTAALDIVAKAQGRPEDTAIIEFDWLARAMDAVACASRQQDEMRFVFVSAPPGGGKSTILRHLQQHPKTRKQTVAIEATEAWRSKATDLLSAILSRVATARRDEDDPEAPPRIDMPQSAAGRLDKIIERIDGHRYILALDELHHVGPEGFNVLKTILNQTSAIIVGAGIPELISRINKKSHVEAQQLFGRLYEHVRVPQPCSSDVLQYFNDWGVKFASPKAANDIARSVTEDAPHHGLWRFVKRCSRAAREKNTTIDPEVMTKIIARVKNATTLGG